MQNSEHPSLKRYEAVVLLSSVVLMSFAILTFEISLIRMFSVMFGYHYSFFAVSISFAGLGLGGILAQLVLSRETPKKDLFANLAAVYSFFSLLISFLLITIVNGPSPDFVAISILIFFPFLPAGIFLATVYRVFAVRSNVLYCADIVGASLGCLAILVFLASFGPVITVLFVSSILSIASILLALISPKKKVLVGVIVIFFLVGSAQFLFTCYGGEIQIGGEQGKELYELLEDSEFSAKIVESRWSAFGRTDLVEIQDNPNFKVIFIDGGAGTQMYRFDGNLTDTSSEVYNLRFSTAAFPFYFTKKENMLIIGPGGGVDVLIAMMFNFSQVYAVEVNQDIVDIVRDYSDFNGGIYTNYSNVNVFVDEGRSFLKRSTVKYDVIVLNIPITKTIQGISGYSMVENYLFTTESFADYLNSLKNDGCLVIVANHYVEVYKHLATALKTLEGMGKSIKESMQQLVVIERDDHFYPVFILKKIPFTPEEANRVFEKSQELGLNPTYFPYADLTPDKTLASLADGELDLHAFVAEVSSLNIDIRPSTDDSPFFAKVDIGLPPTLFQLLVGSIITAAIVLILYLISWGRRLSLAFKKTRHLLAEKFSIFMPYYFASLGLGFMLIEVSLIQKFMLFIGTPTIVVSVVLFSLFISMGVGSFFSKKCKELPGAVLKVPFIVGTIVVLYVLTLPSIFNTFLHLDLTIRSLISFIIVFPLGFFIGMPFPTGIRIMENNFDVTDITWMWGINGLFSLLGSTMAVTIAMLLGFNVALLIGGLAYFTIFLVGKLSLNKIQK